MWLLALGKKTDCGASWGVLFNTGSSEGFAANKPVLLFLSNSGFYFYGERAARSGARSLDYRVRGMIGARIAMITVGRATI